MSDEKKAKIKEELTELGLTTTGHVIALIVKSKYIPMKIFLFIAWLVGVGLTLYLLISSIMDFYQYEVTTKTRLIRETPMIFPKVTICNSDPFVTDASVTFIADILRNDMLFSDSVASATAAGKTADLDLVNWFVDNNVDYTQQALNAALAANETTRASLGFNQQQFVKSCLFNEKTCPDNFIQSTYDVRFGNCFTFNGESRLKSRKSGKFD